MGKKRPSSKKDESGLNRQLLKYSLAAGGTAVRRRRKES